MRIFSPDSLCSSSLKVIASMDSDPTKSNEELKQTVSGRDVRSFEARMRLIQGARVLSYPVFVSLIKMYIPAMIMSDGSPKS